MDCMQKKKQNNAKSYNTRYKILAKTATDIANEIINNESSGSILDFTRSEELDESQQSSDKDENQRKNSHKRQTRKSRNNKTITTTAIIKITKKAEKKVLAAWNYEAQKIDIETIEQTNTIPNNRWTIYRKVKLDSKVNISANVFLSNNDNEVKEDVNIDYNYNFHGVGWGGAGGGGNILNGNGNGNANW